MFRQGLRRGLTSLESWHSARYTDLKFLLPGFALATPDAGQECTLQSPVRGVHTGSLGSRSPDITAYERNGRAWRSWSPLSSRHIQTAGQEKGHAEQFSGKEGYQVTDKVDAKAQVIFDTCWRRLEAKLGTRLQTPKEVVWLNGAPGSGKGVNTPFILESRSLSRAVTMSSLFQDREEIRKIMESGELVPDSMVGDALLDTIFDPDADSAGLVIDGFPRTALQVELLKQLYDKMMALHVQNADTPNEWRFPRPSFKIVVLYVEADESIKRQLLRARQASLHNRRVIDAGTGSLQDIRPTDADIVKCRRRYDVFKAHYGTLLRLKQYFPFSLIDAMGSVEECRHQIVRELRYQSSMDLEEATYSAIRHLPLARELVRTSRQQLVSHLDGYCRKHNAVFKQVIGVIDNEALPILKRCSLAGHAELKTHNPLFSQHPLAAEMLMDILTDRGFATAYFVDEQVVPASVDLQTGEIKNRYEYMHHFRITFESQQVRQATAGRAGAAGEAREPAKLGSTLGGFTICPPGVDHQTPRPNFGNPNFGQTLAQCDVAGREPVLATPDPELEPVKPQNQPQQMQRSQ